MKPLKLDVDPEGAKFLPFAMKKLKDLKKHAASRGTKYARKVLKVSDDATLYLWSFPSMDRIRIEAGGAPWYFLAREFSPLVEGQREWWVNSAEITGSRLKRQELSSGAAAAALAIRTFGKSFCLFRKAADHQILQADGKLKALSDPLGLLTNEAASSPGSIGTSLVGADFGVSRPAFCFLTSFSSESGTSNGLVFTDGNIIEVQDGTDLIRTGACVVGDDTAYYWKIREGDGDEGYYFSLYRAAEAYPETIGGAQTQITPLRVEHFSIEELLTSSPLGQHNVRVVSNDYDVMTVLVRKHYSNYGPDEEHISDDGSGMTEIRIGHELVWSSPGTVASADMETRSGNWDDAAVVFAGGCENEFCVVTSNVTGWFQLNTHGLLSDPYPSLFLRFIRFTRDADTGAYSSSEFSYILEDVRVARIAVSFSVAGIRALLFTWQISDLAPTVHTRTVGWIRDDGVYHEVYDYDDVVPTFDPQQILQVLPTMSGAIGIIYSDELSRVSFSDSEALSYTVHPMGAAHQLIVPFAVTTDGEKMYALVGPSTLLEGCAFIDSDGNTFDGVTDADSSTNLVVDESNRKPYTIVRGLVDDGVGVVRYNYLDQSSSGYADQVDHSLSSTTMPTLSQHYWNRLLRRWIEQDADEEEV